MPTGGNKTPITATFMRGFDATFAPSSAMFSPGVPPTTPDPQPVRRIDFPAGVNLQWTPRAYEAFGFPQLRAFSNVELVRLAIETRKDQIERLDWSVQPKKRKGRMPRQDDADTDIDGDAIAPPITVREIEFLVERLGDEGLNCVAETYKSEFAHLMKGVDVDQAKN